MGKEPPEETVSRIWYGQHILPERLGTTAGQRVQVVYRGRLNGDEGPDYRGALIALDGELRRGDVEVHVRSSHWRAHGHGKDPRYNGVILHVVLWHDASLPILSENGVSLPTLPLWDCLDRPLSETAALERRRALSDETCRLRSLNEEDLGRLLDEQGDERFWKKAAVFQGALADNRAEQVLYEGLMSSLGYSKNQEAFRKLARSLPLSVIEGFLHGKPSPQQSLVSQALLLGSAGLLPSQRGERRMGGVTGEMEKLWRSYRLTPALRREEWRFFRVRPENSPVRRLAGMARLLARNIDKGILESLGEPVWTVDGAKACRDLERRLMATAPSHWRLGYDLGRRFKGLSASLIGHARAREMVVNVVLPFAWAHGELASLPELCQRANAAYGVCPRLAENQITRWMSQLVGEPAKRAATTARRQQGLIHMFHSFCREERCAECPCP